MMTSYKLTYFEGERGRGEPLRMMLTLAGQQYDEENISIEKWMSGYKQETPLGYLPILTTENGELSNTMAILNFLATKLGYQPDSEWERAQSESLMITANDLMQDIGIQLYVFIIWKFQQPVPDISISKKYHFFSQIAHPGARFIFGDRITVADIFLYTVTDFISVLFPETRSVNEWCKGWIANMEADEKFSEYLRSRPPAGIHLT